MVPVNELLSNSNSSNLERRFRQVGIVPTRRLPDISMYFISVALHNALGNVPVNLLPLRYSLCNSKDSNPNSLGMVPDIPPLLLRSRRSSVDKYVNLDSSGSIVPLKP